MPDRADQPTDFHREVAGRLLRLTGTAASGGLDDAVEILVRCVAGGGVIHAFGTGHSEAFAMEIAGRAGGLIPTSRIALRDVVLYGGYAPDQLEAYPPLERDPGVAAALFATVSRDPADAFIIASNSGGNASTVGLAVLAKEHGHPVIAVTSLEHTARVSSSSPGGRRLADVADVVLDNLAPFGDAALPGPDGTPVGAVSSITAAYLAQLLTIATARRLAGDGVMPPVYLSANIPGGDEHNRALEEKYRGRIRRSA